MVDFRVEIVGAVERPPPLKDGVGYLKDAPVDLGVRRGESANKVLNETR